MKRETFIETAEILEGLEDDEADETPERAVIAGIPVYAHARHPEQPHHAILLPSVKGYTRDAD